MVIALAARLMTTIRGSFCTAAVLLLVSCTNGAQEDSSNDGRPTSPGSSGSLEGLVRLLGEGAPPTATMVENTTDPEECGREHSLEDLLVSARTRGIQNVILSLSGVAAEKVPELKADRLVMDNVECRFSPHAAVLTVGSTLEALNSDMVLHTTHLYGPIESNIALPFQGSRVDKVLENPGMIIVKCDVHGWMQAFVRVDPHPFHAVSDAEGRFRIGGIPPGDYALEAWHEKLGRQQLNVHVVAGRTEAVELEFDSDIRSTN